MQPLGGEGGCICLDTLKWRLLKEAAGELMMKDKKHRPKIHLRGESLDKALGMHRNPQTYFSYFSISTVQDEKRKEE